tara:strand:+ start:335 stop:1447 length:1113 start_codon:yes stop_codon:yes gene_type:complete
MNFQKSNQNFEKGGIIYNNYVLGTKKIGTPNFKLRSNLEISNVKDPYTRLSTFNMSDDDIRENIKLSSCHNEKHTLMNLQSNLSNNPGNQSLVNQVQDAQDDLNNCVETFYQTYKNPDKNITRNPSSNILPNNYPIKDQEVFGSNLNSCVDSQKYHTPYDVYLPQKDESKKLVYGTNRGYDNDIIGPRVFDINNMNKQTPFNTKDSGYNIQNNDEMLYNNQIVENYDDHEEGEGEDEGINPKNYCDNNKCSGMKYNYKNSENVYNGSCGTKSTLGTISDKLDQRPHLSEFVKNNIIGNNFDNMNRASLYGKNKATFNNPTLESLDLNLNDVRKSSHMNYIMNTNKLRTEFNDNYFKQKTSKMQNNLNNRG